VNVKKDGEVPRPTVNSRHSPARSGRLLIVTCGFTLTLILCVLSLYRPAFLDHLDGRFYDGLIADDVPPEGYSGPVVVAVDDESLARFGRWPWPRTLVARLLTRIAAQDPAGVGIDAIFAEREIAIGSERVAGVADRLSAGDLALAAALAGGPFVLGFELTFPPHTPTMNHGRLLHPLNILSVRKKGAADPRKRLWQANGAVSSLPEFSRSVAISGFLNAAMEQDGILRRMPVLIEEGEDLFPSLALATVLRTNGSHSALLESAWWGDLILKVGERRIPLDDRGRLLLRFRGWHGHGKPVSAAALLEGRVPDGMLKGRIVFVGATATGMGEAVATPVNNLLSGVQVHAIAAENILRGDFARLTPWAWQLLAILALGIVSTLVCVGLPVMRGALLLGAVAAGGWQGSVWLFQTSGLLLSPVSPIIVMFANFSLLTLIRSFFVEKKAQRQTEDLAKTRDFIMTSLASLAEIRDIETGAHIMRTQRYLLILCRELSRHPRFKHLLNQEKIELIAKLAPLHDIGKVGLPDHLLRKTTGFTDEEYEEVKKHAVYGRDAISRAEARSGAYNDELLQYAKDIAYSHHERWDGTGYPEGLRGEQIPWVGRLMALADAYDAIVSRRIYKEPVTHEAAVRIISEGRGTLFDPDVVDAFLRVEDQWRQIARELADSADGEMAEK
jgi:HD-GYP domain-containing protein (c-di-GMP phosphodiesterase class II)